MSPPQAPFSSSSVSIAARCHKLRHGQKKLGAKNSEAGKSVLIPKENPGSAQGGEMTLSSKKKSQVDAAQVCWT